MGEDFFSPCVSLYSDYTLMKQSKVVLSVANDKRMLAKPFKICANADEQGMHHHLSLSGGRLSLRVNMSCRFEKGSQLMHWELVGCRISSLFKRMSRGRGRM